MISAFLNFAILDREIYNLAITFPKKTKIMNRRRSASIAGVKRRGSCSVAVVGAGPALPSAPLEADVVPAKNPHADAAPSSVVIRDD